MLVGNQEKGIQKIATRQLWWERGKQRLGRQTKVRCRNAMTNAVRISNLKDSGDGTPNSFAVSLEHGRGHAEGGK